MLRPLETSQKMRALEDTRTPQDHVNRSHMNGDISGRQEKMSPESENALTFSSIEESRADSH
jgi:hypothetical protein